MHSALLLEMAAEGLGSRIALGSTRGGVSFSALLERALRAGTHIASMSVANVAYSRGDNFCKRAAVHRDRQTPATDSEAGSVEACCGAWDLTVCWRTERL